MRERQRQRRGEHMLHEFLTSNREELIARCKTKATTRTGTAAPASLDGEGIPRFLAQLVETLRREQASGTPEVAMAGLNAASEIGLAAAQHGAELRRRGFSVDQVVHDYGNVCQSITELAIERDLPMSTHEFRTLNRCLDDAIADAVTGFARGGAQAADEQAEVRHERANAFSNEHQRLIDIAIQSFSAIKTGHVGATGATGALLTHALGELRRLTEHVRREPAFTTVER